MPGKQKPINIYYPHVALAHVHAETISETASQLDVEVVFELVPFAGCSEAKRRKMHVPKSTNSRSTNPLSVGVYTCLESTPRRLVITTT